MNLLIFNLRMDAKHGPLGFTTDWVNALSHSFDRVWVITMVAGELRVAPNVTVISLGQELGHSRFVRARIFYRELGRLLRTERIDACFAHMNHLFAVLAWPLLKLKRIPILLWYAHKSVTPMLRLAERLVDGVVTSSSSGFQLESSKVKVIGQGIDTDRFAPGPRDFGDRPIRLLTIGRISPIKRNEVAIQALGLLRDLAPGRRFQLILVGDPLTDLDRDYLAGLKVEAERLSVIDSIDFRGGVPFDRVEETFCEADIFLNSGDTDSVDKAVLEALSTGVPTITSNFAFKDILPASMHEVCLAPKHDPAALARAVLRIIDMEPAEREQLSQAGRALVVQEHSLVSLARKIEGELRRLAH